LLFRLTTPTWICAARLPQVTMWVVAGAAVKCAAGVD
jgi:hypothetical protein